MQESSKVNTLVKNTSWVYVNKVFFSILQVIVTILVIRKLDIDIYGTFNFLIASFFIFQIFAASQVASVFDRYIPELIKNKDYRRFKKLVTYGIFIAIFGLSVLIILLYVFQKPFADLFNFTDFEKYLPAFIAYVVGRFSRVITESLIKAMLLHKQYAIINMLVAALRSILYLYFLPQITINLMLYIEASIGILYGVASFSVAVVKYKKVMKTHNTADVIESDISASRVMKFGLYSVFNELGANIVQENSDVFIIKAMGNSFMLGLYTFAFKIYHILFQILPLKDFFSVLRPLFFQKFTSEHTKEDFVHMFNFIIKFMLPLLTFPALYFFIFGKEVIEFVFDPKYVAAYTVTCIIMSNYIFTALFFPVGMTIQLKERMDIALAGKAVVIFSLAAGFLGMKYFGIEGVAVATVLGLILKNLLMLFLMRDKAHMEYRLLEFKNYLFISIALVVLFYFTESFIINIWRLGIISVIYVVVAGVLVIMYHPFTAKDMVLIHKMRDSSKIGKKIAPYIAKVYSLKPNLG